MTCQMEDVSNVLQVPLEVEDHKGFLENEGLKDLKDSLAETEETDTKEDLVHSVMLDHPAHLETLDLTEDLDKMVAEELEDLENPDLLELLVLLVFPEIEVAMEAQEPLENPDLLELQEMMDMLDSPEDPDLLEIEDFLDLILITVLVLLDKSIILDG